MRVAVMATGGLGGTFGALLARAGHDVSFIARGAHLAAMRERGLTIRTAAGDVRVSPVRATAEPAEVGPVDLVLFAVKAYDNEAAIGALGPLLGPETTIATLQNGVGAADEIGAVHGLERVILAPTQIVSNLIAPGVIEQKSAFRITVVGEIGGRSVTPRVEAVTAELKKAGVDASAAADGRVALWDKFVFLSSTAGLTALARTDAHDLFRRVEAAEALRAALEEVWGVGRAEGVALPADTVERWHRFSCAFEAGAKFSMHLDLERGNRLEIDALSGTVVALGTRRGIPTPVHQTIFVGLKPEDDRARVRRATR